MGDKTQHRVDTQVLQMFNLSMIVCTPIPCEDTAVLRLRDVSFGRSFCSYKF